MESLRRLTSPQLGREFRCQVLPSLRKERESVNDGSASFEDLLSRAEADLRAYVGALVRDPQQRQDVFQEIAVTLWLEFSKYDPTRSFGAWARGVATNKILQAMERERRWRVVLSPEAIAAIQAGFDRVEAEDLRHQRLLEKCLARLPERWRRIVQLRYHEQWKATAIAESLQISADAVYQALTRIRRQLATCLRRATSED